MVLYIPKRWEWWMVDPTQQVLGGFDETHGVESCVDTGPLAINAHMRYRARCHCGASFQRSTRAEAMQRLRAHINSAANRKMGNRR